MEDSSSKQFPILSNVHSMGAQYPGFRSTQLMKDTKISHMDIQQVEVGEHWYPFARHCLLSILSTYGLTPVFFLSVACCCLGLVP